MLLSCNHISISMMCSSHIIYIGRTILNTITTENNKIVSNLL